MNQSVHEENEEFLGAPNVVEEKPKRGNRDTTGSGERRGRGNRQK